MKRYAFLATVFSTALIVALPFVGGGGPGLNGLAVATTSVESPALASIVEPEAASNRIALRYGGSDQVIEARSIAISKSLSSDWEHLAQKPVPKPLPPVDAAGAASGTTERRAQLEAQGLSCPGFSAGGTSGAPGAYSALGVAGTTSDDLASFAYQYNAIRAQNCLPPVTYFVYDSCMEARLFWMAESPSPDPMDAWGHIGSVRIDGAPSVGCDGNLAGGSGNSGSTVAIKWWESASHQASLYRPSSGTGGVCIAFAMTHGGIDEPYSFTRAAARWTYC
ncbi:MAG: hypothetical protein ACKVOG_04230 [Rhodoglobus sp.]